MVALGVKLEVCTQHFIPAQLFLCAILQERCQTEGSQVLGRRTLSMKTHSGEKSKKCNQCDYALKQVE